MNCNRALSIIFLGLILLWQPLHALTKVVVFPFVNKTGDTNLDWVRYAPAESFGRVLPRSVEYQVIDPAFLFSVDSTGWTMENDSVLKLHWMRWGWNMACGGSISRIGDELSIELRTLYLKNDRPQRKKTVITGKPEAALALCASLIETMAAIGGNPIDKNGLAEARRKLTNSPTALATYFAGYGFEMRGANAEALSAYARSAEIDPAFSSPSHRMARLYRTSGAIDKARQMYAVALKLDPTAPDIVADAADFSVSYDPAGKALDFIKKRQVILEQTASGMTAMGKSMLLAGELQRSVAMLTRAIARGPVDLEADFFLGRAYLMSGEFTKAIDVFNRLVRYQPRSPRFYALLGAAYRNAGRIMESLSVLESSSAQFPGNVALMANVAHTYFQLGWYGKAEQVLLEARSKFPDVVDLYVDLGVVSWFTNKKAEAQTYLSTAQKMGRNIQSAVNNEANISFLSGRMDDAIDLYRTADRIGGHSETVLANLAIAYQAAGRLDDAAGCWRAVLSLSPSRRDALDACASIALKRNKEEDAMLYYRKILEISPRDVDALTLLTTILVRRGMYKEAIEPIEAYLAQFPSSKQFALLLADVYRKMGWYEVAMEKYQAYIKDYPQDYEGYIGLGRSMFDRIQFKNGRDYDKAIFTLKKAADINKTAAEPEYIMGLIYLDFKNYRELAVDSFKAALPKATDETMKKSISDALSRAGK